MVQNRNWETRFELSVARRQQAKQRKQLTQNKKQSKAWAQGLLKLLDRHAEWLIVKESIAEIHVWVDRSTSTHMEECSSQRELTLSQEAVVASRDDQDGDEITNPGGMDMVHHLVIKLQVQSVQDEASASSSISEQISQTLAQNDMKLGDIVYVTISNTLIYDRYREGVLLSEDRDFLLAVAGEGAVFGRKVSIARDVEDNDMILLHLPGAVLEHVLTFLPDAAVASLSRVCKSWHLEIGQHSPHLWRHLLERRNWPLPAPLTPTLPWSIVKRLCNITW
jgi:hypothetical protein